MTNKEKLIAIIGEDNFRKLEKNFDPAFSGHFSLNECIDCKEKDTIGIAFDWERSPEGWGFWNSLDVKLIDKWGVPLRKITNEEHDLMFKMFVMEWMEYPWGDNERWYNLVFSQGYGLKIYEALRSE